MTILVSPYAGVFQGQTWHKEALAHSSCLRSLHRLACARKHRQVGKTGPGWHGSLRAAGRVGMEVGVNLCHPLAVCHLAFQTPCAHGHSHPLTISGRDSLSNVWTDGRLKTLNDLLGGAIYQGAKTKGCGHMNAPYRLTQCDFNSQAAFFQRAAGFWHSPKKFSFASAVLCLWSSSHLSLSRKCPSRVCKVTSLYDHLLLFKRRFAAPTEW